MLSTAVELANGLHFDRLADPANFAELIYAQEWGWIHSAGGVPVDIYPAGVADDRLHTVCATLAQWLGSPEGDVHVRTSTDTGQENGEVDFWHPSPDQILPLSGCQEHDMAFGFFEWLSSADGVDFIAQCQKRIVAFKSSQP